MPAISYVGGVGSSRAGATSTTTQSISGTLTGGSDTSPSVGDFMVVTVVTGTVGRTPSTTPTLPVSSQTNLTQLQANGSTNDTMLTVSYGFYSAGTTVTLPSTGNVADAQTWTVMVFRGVDPTTPLDGVTPTSATGTGTSRPDPPSITPSSASTVVCICAGGAAGTGATLTFSGLTASVTPTRGTDTTDAVVGSGYVAGTAGVATNIGASSTGEVAAGDSWAAYSLVLRAQTVFNEAVTETATVSALYGGMRDPSTLTDNFTASTLDTTKWAELTDTGVTVTTTGGTLNITTTSGYGGVASASPNYNLYGNAAYVRFVQPMQGLTSTGGGIETFFRVDTGVGNFLQFDWVTDGSTNGTLLSSYAISDGQTQTNSAAYSSTTHAWLRIRESGGTVYWDTAPSSASDPPSSGDWVNFGSVTTATLTWALDGVFFVIMAGGSNGTTPTGPAKFDGFNTATTAGTTYNESQAETSTPTDSPSAVSVRVGAVAETATVTAAETSLGTFGSSVVETATVTETSNAASVRVGAVAETATVTETENASPAYSADMAETAAVTEVGSASSTRIGAVAEAATVDHTVAAGLVAVGSVTEAATVTNTQTAIAVFGSAVAETALADHATTALVTFPNSVVEAATVSHTVAATGVFPNALAETATVTAAEVGGLLTASAVTETATVTDRTSGFRPASLLTDEFPASTVDTATKWVLSTPGTTTAETAGSTLNLTTDAAGDYAAVFSAQPNYKLYNEAIYVKLVQPLPVPASTAAGFEVLMRVHCPDDATSFINFNWTTDGTSTGSLNADFQNAGTPTHVAGPTAYSSTTHAWLRIREASNTLYWETAASSASNPPGSGDWAVFASTPTTDLTWSLDNVYFSLQAGGAVVSVTPSGPAKFDGFNTGTGSGGITYDSDMGETATVTQTQTALAARIGAVAETSTVTEAGNAAAVRTGAVAETATVTDREAGWGPASTFQDSFPASAVDTTKWVVTTPASTSADTVGNTLNLLSTAGNYVSIKQNAGGGKASLYDSAMFARFIQPPQGLGGTVGGVETFMRGDNGGVGNFVQWNWATNGTSTGVVVASYAISSAQTEIVSVAYNATTHAWLRIRETSGTTYWETAPSTASNPPLEADWVVAGSTATSNIPWSLDGVKLQFQMGGSNGTTPTGAAKWDGFNMGTGGAAAHAVAVVETATVTHAQTAQETRVGALAETATVTTAFTGGLVLPSALAESLPLADALAAAFAYSVTLSESASPTDALSAVFPITGLLIETCEVLDDFFGRKQWETVGEHVDGQWAAAATTQTPAWGEISPNYDPGWTSVSTTQTPTWDDPDTTNDPGWTS